MSIAHKTLDGIPVSIATPLKRKSKALILYYHGLFGSIENNLQDLLFLSKRGFTVVGVDNHAHGRRLNQEVLDQIHPENPLAEQLFLDLVLATAKEIPNLMVSLKNTGVYQGRPLGVSGVSMGGYISYTAPIFLPNIKAIGTIVGSPRYKIDLPESPHYHLDCFENLAVFSQNASLDEIVPTAYARDFHGNLKSKYPERSDAFPYREFPLSGHFLRDEDWEVAQIDRADFFDQWLV